MNRRIFQSGDWDFSGLCLFLCNAYAYVTREDRVLVFILFMDLVYFVHPSTDISVDISVDISTDTRPIYRSTYRPSVTRYVGRHIGQVSDDMSTEMCRSTYRPMYQPRYRPSDGRHIGRLSADISVDIAADTRPIRWPLIVGGISVDRRWYIGQKLRLLVY